jgi:uncharacterized protein YjiS (DUF1127 family)
VRQRIGYRVGREASKRIDMHTPHHPSGELALSSSPGLTGLARTVEATLASAFTAVRESWTRWAQRREARATMLALSELDDHTLHDIGLDRSEIGSIAAEVASSAAASRVRVLQARIGPL